MLHGVGVRVPSAARKLEACSSYEEHAFLFLFFRNGKGSDVPMSPMLTWEAGKNCQGYNIRWGIAPDKLYNSWLVYGKNELLLKSLTTDQSYYFTIEAFNENGISEPARLVEVQ